MKKEYIRALISMGYRKFGEIWLKPFANSVFVFNPKKMALSQKFRNLQGVVTTNHSETFKDDGGLVYPEGTKSREVDPTGFLLFIGEVESEFRYLPMCGQHPEERFQFISLAEEYDYLS
jgi:hypothetical protein